MNSFKGITHSFKLFSQACDYLAQRLFSRKADLDVRHVVITPKEYTLHFEQLLSKNGGFFDIEVVSLSRLYYKLSTKPLLPQERAIMDIKKILKNSNLRCFNKSKGFAGFCNKLLGTINRFIDSGIAPDQLDESSPKYADIKQVYGAFTQANPQSMAQMLVQLLGECDYFANAHVYVANFDTPTRLEQRIFDIIAQRALSLTHLRAQQHDMPTLPPIEVYWAQNKALQLKAAARRIKKAVREGIALSEMCIVCSQSSFESASRILSEYEIDFYCDKPQRLSSGGLGQYVLTMLRGASRRNDFVRLSKNPYMGIELADACSFENYCLKYNIEYVARQFELGTQTERDAAERVRAAIGARLHRLRQGLSSRGLQFLREFLLAIQPFEGDEPIKTRLMEILLLIDEEDADFKELFYEAAESAQLRPLPYQCGISVSDAAATRGKRFKKAFILDFNEGVMPARVQQLGLMSASECAQMQLSPSVEHINQASRNDITELIYSSDEVFLAYVRSSSERPSPLLYTILQDAPTIRQGNTQAEYEQLLLQGSVDQLADYACCKNGGLEQLFLSLQRPDVFSSSLYASLKEHADRIISRAQYSPKIITQNVFDLFAISASRLQTYYDCPYKHFVKYGLRAKQNERGGMSALDTGLLIHRAAEAFFLSGFNTNQLEQIIAKAMADFVHKLQEKTRQRLSEEIKKLCEYLKQNLNSSKFKPLGAELRLNDSKLKPVFINGAQLSGSIDFADTYGDYVRVIDYKSGQNVGFESKTLYYGLKLQLPLYMYALMHNGFRPAAMLFFPFRLRWNSNGCPFVGVLNNDLDLVYAMDTTLAQFDGQTKMSSNVVPITLSPAKEGIRVGGSGAKELQELVKISQYAFDLSRLALRQMAEGLIEPLPYKSSFKTSCSYCNYKIACGFCGSFRILSSKKIGQDYANE